VGAREPLIKSPLDLISGSLADWIIALTKLGRHEKDFVFVGGKWTQDLPATVG